MKLQNTFIEMYNAAQYPSWEAADNHGGIYSSIVYMVDEPFNQPGEAFIFDMMEAAHTAAKMMDGSAEIQTRVVRRNV